MDNHDFQPVTSAVDPQADPFDTLDELPTNRNGMGRAIIGGVASIAIFAALIGANFFPIPTGTQPAAVQSSVTQAGGVTITAVGPLEAAVGATVTVSGTGFAGNTTDNIVKFNDTSASISNVVAHTEGTTDLTVVVPRLAADTDYTVSVKTPTGTASFGETFRLIAQRTSVGTSTGVVASGMPEITVIEPATGAVGSAIYISGNNFDSSAVRNSVRFASSVNMDGVPATKVEWVTVAGEQKLKAIVPAGATTGRISLVRDNLKAESPDVFTVTDVAVSADGESASVTPPQIAGLSVSSATPGGKLLISGLGLTKTPGSSAGVMVKFDGVAGTVHAASTDVNGVDTLLVEVPSGARSGYVTVEVGGRTAISPMELIVENNSPSTSTPGTFTDSSVDDSTGSATSASDSDLAADVFGDPISPPATNAELFGADVTNDISTPGVDAPRQLTVRGDAASLTLSWQSPAVGAPVGYRVYYGTTPGVYLRRVEVPGAAASVTLTDGFTAGTRYYLVLRAIDATGTESAGAEVNAVFGTETSFTAEPVMTQPMTLSDMPSADAIPTIDFGHAAARPVEITQNPPTELSEQGPAETLAVAVGVAMIGSIVIIARRRKLV